MVNSAGLLRTLFTHATAEHTTETAAAAAEELREQVLGVHATTTATILKTLFAELVVNLALLGIGKGLVGVGQLLELLSSLGVVGVLVYRNEQNVSRNEQRM